MKTEKTVPYAVKLLSDGLQEQALQIQDSDKATIAKILNRDVRTVRQYLKGNVQDIETGKEILKATRTFILKRENEIKKLIA